MKRVGRFPPTKSHRNDDYFNNAKKKGYFGKSL